MSFSEDAWLSTRNKTKIQIKPGPLKRRSSLPKRKPTQPSGIYTLTQTSPPPKELFTAKKQSKLSEFFGRKNETSEVVPEKIGHSGEEQNENLEDSSNKGRYSYKSKDLVHIHLSESRIEQDTVKERDSFPLTETKINNINVLTAKNRRMKRLLSGDIEETVSKRTRGDPSEIINDLNEHDVGMINDNHECSLVINVHTKDMHDYEQNKQTDDSLNNQKLCEVDKVTLNKDGSFKHHEITKKIRAGKKMLENINMCYINITEHTDKTVKQLKNVNCVSDKKEKIEIVYDLLENRQDPLTELNQQLKSDSTEHPESIQIGSYSKGLKNCNSPRRTDAVTASHLSKESSANCNQTNVCKDHENDHKSSKDRLELDNSLDLSESTYKNSHEESLNLETQTFTGNIRLYHEESQSQLNLSEDSESSLQLCTQFSLSSS